MNNIYNWLFTFSNSQTPKVMDINFYCDLSVPSLSKKEGNEYLKDFLEENDQFIIMVCNKFLFFYESSHDTNEGILHLKFTTQYFKLKQIKIVLDLIESLIKNLTYKKGFEVGIEFHLDE